MSLRNAKVTQFPVNQAEAEIRAAWASYKRTEKQGLKLGEVLYRWQQKHGAQGSRTGGGLRPILAKVGIPKTTCYFWISRYLISIGKRKETKKVAVIKHKPGQVTQALSAIDLTVKRWPKDRSLSTLVRALRERADTLEKLDRKRSIERAKAIERIAA